MQTQVVVIGAGPAGLTAAYLLSQNNIPVIVLEADPHYVGGIAKTVNYKGYCFDIGGHRFFSQAEEIEQLWSAILPYDMLERPRSSRIFYRQQFFSYPLKPLETLCKLGAVESCLCILSYIKARLLPIKTPRSFSDWIINHFGERLFRIFFKTYTEKVWGMRCEEISADWAAQRIKGLSLSSAIFNALIPKKWFKPHTKPLIKTLIDTFRYPRKGPGMLWEACAEKIKLTGGKIYLNSEVYKCEYLAEKKQWRIYYRDNQGNDQQIIATHIISSAPLRDVVTTYLSPSLSAPTMKAAKQLQYRDFLIVVLILKDKKQFSDNWIYVHESSVDVARIQNFRSWSPEMVPEPGMCSYGMEYFCFKGDQIWNAADEELLLKARKEIIKLGLAVEEDIVDGCVVRQAKAYPVYDNDYQSQVSTIREELSMKFPSFYLVGRNGMHKYNNQDHAMMTAILTVKNIIAGRTDYNVWQVNQDAEYIESGTVGERNVTGSLRHVPQRILPSSE